jgi:hypothetical protein
VSTQDPDAVAVLARCLHQTECPPKRTPWSKAHLKVERDRARRILTCLVEAGYEITSKES